MKRTGASSQTRTDDLPLTRRLHYQLCYAGRESATNRKIELKACFVFRLLSRRKLISPVVMNIRIKKVFVLGLLACLSALFSACRSAGDSVWKEVDFVSTPEGATVFINGKNCGITPRTELLSRLGNYTVRFSKPGFFDEDIILESFMNENGQADILERVELSLVKITPESLALRERGAQSSAEVAATVPADAADGNAPAVAPSASGGMSPAAREFAARAKPTDFTDFRLQEKMLKRLFQRKEISEEEYRALHEALYNTYNENRLLKAPRLGTYEKAF